MAGSVLTVHYDLWSARPEGQPKSHIARNEELSLLSTESLLDLIQYLEDFGGDGQINLEDAWRVGSRQARPCCGPSCRPESVHHLTSQQPRGAGDESGLVHGCRWSGAG